jgi:hypothetical protein
MQGLNICGMIWGNDANKYLKNFTNGCFCGLKIQHIGLLCDRGFYEDVKFF